MQYLKKRTLNFSKGEKAVTLLTDEVHAANFIEYQNGTFVGLIEDGACARTVLTFMVQSVCKTYKDVVCLVAVEKLDTSWLHYWFNKIIKYLNEFFSCSCYFCQQPHLQQVKNFCLNLMLLNFFCDNLT